MKKPELEGFRESNADQDRQAQPRHRRKPRLREALPPGRSGVGGLSQGGDNIPVEIEDGGCPQHAEANGHQDAVRSRSERRVDGVKPREERECTGGQNRAADAFILGLFTRIQAQGLRNRPGTPPQKTTAPLRQNLRFGGRRPGDHTFYRCVLLDRMRFDSTPDRLVEYQLDCFTDVLREASVLRDPGKVVHNQDHSGPLDASGSEVDGHRYLCCGQLRFEGASDLFGCSVANSCGFPVELTNERGRVGGRRLQRSSTLEIEDQRKSTRAGQPARRVPGIRGRSIGDLLMVIHSVNLRAGHTRSRLSGIRR